MGELYFVAEDPTISVSRYASRISQSIWQKHLQIIQHLHEMGLTRREILHELTRYGFYPSFGQLVAQMTRWQPFRYSKPVQASTKELPLPGIMGLTSILLATDPSPICPRSTSPPFNYASTASGLSQLMSALSINTKATNHSSGVEATSVNPCYDSCRQLLSAADVMFLGGSYAHAFHTYRDVSTRIVRSEMTVAEEQLQVQAIIGCLKSAANHEQQEEGILIAQGFLDNLVPHANSAAGLYPSLKKYCLQTAVQKWQNRDCVTAKTIFELLTAYKRHRSWATTSHVQWAKMVTTQEYASLRLVRIPTWQEAVPYLDSTPVSCVRSTAVFDLENLIAILSWAIMALQDFGNWYDEQVLQLNSVPAVPQVTYRSLLFWRFDFFSRHSQACPSLNVHLSEETTYVAPAQQTVCVLACIIFEHQQMPVTSGVNKMMLLEMCMAIEKGCTGIVLASFWHGLRAALTPSYDERCHDCST